MQSGTSQQIRVLNSLQKGASIYYNLATQDHVLSDTGGRIPTSVVAALVNRNMIAKRRMDEFSSRMDPYVITPRGSHYWAAMILQALEDHVLDGVCDHCRAVTPYLRPIIQEPDRVDYLCEVCREGRDRAAGYIAAWTKLKAGRQSLLEGPLGLDPREADVLTKTTQRLVQGVKSRGELVEDVPTFSPAQALETLHRIGVVAAFHRHVRRTRQTAVRRRESVYG